MKTSIRVILILVLLNLAGVTANRLKSSIQLKSKNRSNQKLRLNNRNKGKKIFINYASSNVYTMSNSGMRFKKKTSNARNQKEVVVKGTILKKSQ